MAGVRMRLRSLESTVRSTFTARQPTRSIRRRLGNEAGGNEREMMMTTTTGERRREDVMDDATVNQGQRLRGELEAIGKMGLANPQTHLQELNEERTLRV